MDYFKSREHSVWIVNVLIDEPGQNIYNLFGTTQIMSLGIQLTEFSIHYQRKVKTNCEICASSFKTIGKSEHICKKCYRSVCDSCSQKAKCYMPNYKIQTHRNCRKCVAQSQSLQRYIKNNHLKWGEDSDLVKFWTRQMGLKSLPRKRPTQSKPIKQYVTFNQLWNSLNFSLREFMGIVLDQSKISQKVIMEQLNSGLYQLATNKLADLQHLVYILLFFLAHSNAHNAVFFTTLVFQTIYTEQFSMENMQYFLEQMGCIQIEIFKMESVIEETFERIAKRCTVNVFPVEISIQIINRILMKRNFEQIEKGICLVFSQRKQFICQNSNKPQTTLLDILKNCSISSFKRATNDIDGAIQDQLSLCRSANSKNSDNSDQASGSSSINRQVNKLKKQNEQLKGQLKNQSVELEQLRNQNQILKAASEAKKQSEKKVLEINFSKTVSEMNLGKEKTHKDKYGFSTSEEDDELNYNHIIHKKNEQIITLKKNLEQALQNIKFLTNAQGQAKPQDQREIGNNHTDRRAIREKEEQIQRLKQECESLKNTNKVLFNKLTELSKLLMDKEEKNIEEANKFFDQLGQGKGDLQSKSSDCKIY